MRILVAGDLHGPAGLRHADTMAQTRGCEMILQVGDFAAYGAWVKTPTRFVCGNHERWHIIRARDFGRRISMLEDYQTYGFGGLTVGSLGRIQRSQAHLGLISRGWFIGHRDHIWIEEDIEAADNLLGSDVLVFHDKPHFELADEDFLCQVVRRVEPSLVLHGHMHTYEVTEPIPGTTVVSLPPCDPSGPVVLSSGDQTPAPVVETFILDTEKRTLRHPERGGLTF